MTSLEPAWQAMARRPLPRNAEATLLDEPLVVSLVGQTSIAAPHVFIEPGRRYDWRFAHSLDVFIAVRPKCDARLAINDLYQVANLYPTLVDFDRKVVASVVQGVDGLTLWPRHRGSEPWRAFFD